MVRRVTVDVSELGDEVESMTQERLLEIANTLVNRLKDNAPVGATGDLQRLTQIWHKEPGRIEITMPDYAKNVNEGTAPPPQGPEPEFEEIVVWARRKLNDEEAAGPVYHKLMTEGQNANPYIDRSINETMERFR